MSRYFLATGYLSGLRPGFATCVAAYGFVALLVVFAALSRFALDGDTLPARRTFYAGLLLFSATFLLTLCRRVAWYGALLSILAVPLAGILVSQPESELWRHTTPTHGVGFLLVLTGAFASLILDPNVYSRHFAPSERPGRVLFSAPVLFVVAGFYLLVQTPSGIGSAFVLAIAIFWIEPLRACIRAAWHGQFAPVTDNTDASVETVSGSESDVNPEMILTSRVRRCSYEKKKVIFSPSRLTDWFAIIVPIAGSVALIGLVVWFGL